MSRQPPQVIRWFADSPNAGSPACICSYCGNRIEARAEGGEFEFEELNADEGEPIRLWTNGGNPPCKEARFHPRCLEACLDLGLVEMPRPQNDSGGKP